eukprot:5640247-Alexandrium_andersonii.AAC.1
MDEPQPGTPAIPLLSALPGWAAERYGSLERLLRPWTQELEAGLVQGNRQFSKVMGPFDEYV